MPNQCATKRAYYFDSYLEEHQAMVTAIHHDESGYIVELNETIFHPQGGGQPSDSGTINGVSVLRVVEKEEIILHQLQAEPSFLVGDVVALKIDVMRRKEYAKLHTGGHLIAHLIEEKYPELKAIRGHHFPGQSRVEFKRLSEAAFPNKKIVETELKLMLSDIIALNHSIQSFYDEKQGRRVSIGNFEETPCGGTHVSNLGELAQIQIRSVKVKSGTFRVGYQL